MSAGEDHLPAPGSAFAISRRGYDPAQVDDYLRHLDTQLRMLAADRDAAVEQNGQLTRQVNVAWAETDRLKGQVRRLSVPPESVEGMSERLRTMLRLAQEEIAERHRIAEVEAADLVAKAEATVTDLRRHLQDEQARLEREHRKFKIDREGLLTEANAEADRIRAETKRLRTDASKETTRLRAQVATEIEQQRKVAADERAALDAASVAHRHQVEEDFTIAIAARRAEAMASIEQSRTSNAADVKARLDEAAAQAARHIEDATAKADQLVADAEQAAREAVHAATLRVRELDSLRDRMRGQLIELRMVLDQAVPSLAPAGVETVAATDTPSEETTERASGGEQAAATAPVPRPSPRRRSPASAGHRS